jgi:predicted transcriptional regulator
MMIASCNDNCYLLLAAVVSARISAIDGLPKLCKEVRSALRRAGRRAQTRKDGVGSPVCGG